MGNARVCVVTGYVRLDLPNRTHEEYVRLGKRLVSACGPHKWRIFGDEVHELWHYRMSDGCRLPDGNPYKDTRAFHAVQHEKTAWMARAAEQTDADMLVWLDYGLLHVPGVTEDKIARFLDRVAQHGSRFHVGMASIWGEPQDDVDCRKVAWHCAGGVFVCPRTLAGQWHSAVVRAATALQATGWATWEVNTWAAAWRANPDLVTSWPCDHDGTILEYGP